MKIPNTILGFPSPTNRTPGSTLVLLLALFPASDSLLAQFGFSAPYDYLLVNECPAANVNLLFEISDFNEDGTPDVGAGAVMPGCGTCAGVRISTTQNCVEWVGTQGAAAFVSADVNNDGHVDIVMADYPGGPTELGIFIGDGSGSFSGPTSTEPAGIDLARQLNAADLNNDGQTDITVYSGAPSGTLTLLLGQGGGNFSPFDTLGQYYEELKIVDLDSDGNEDLVYLFYGGVTVQLGNGDGSFQPPSVYWADVYTGQLILDDLDGDGTLDFIVTAFDDDLVSVLLGPNYDTPSLYYILGGRSTASADFNQDGYIDLVTTIYGTGLAVLPGDPQNPGHFLDAIIIPVASTNCAYSFFHRIKAADFNGDNLPDLAIYAIDNCSNLKILLLENDPSSSGCPPLTVPGAVMYPACHGDPTGSIDIDPPNGGTPPYAYAWSNGANTQDLVNIPAGGYSVTVSDAGGCTGVSAFNVWEPPILNLSTTATQVTCYGASNGQASVSVAGGTPGYIYQWSNGSNTSTITNLSPGTYMVTVEDSNGCYQIGSAMVDGPEEPLVLSVSGQDVTCHGSADGMATADVTGGVPGYAYTWSNGATTATVSNLGPGNYSVWVTDEFNCVVMETVSITTPTPVVLSVSGQAISCFGQSDGSAAVSATGGVPGYIYGWSNGADTPAISNLPAGTYIVTVTDNNGCTKTASYVVTMPTPLEADIATTDVTTYGGSDGTATAAASGGTSPYDFDWSTGDTTQVIEGLTAGDYSVTITDANGCQVNEYFFIEQPSCGIESSIAAAPISCAGGSDGMATATYAGGTGTIHFLWNTGDTTQTIIDLSAGAYSVTVSDGGCEDFSQVVLSDPPAIVSMTSAQPTQCTDSTGQVAVTASGGTGSLSILWSTGDTTGTVDSLAAGTYTVTLTDGNGCTSVNQATVGNIDTQPPVMIQDTVVLYLDSTGHVSDHMQLAGHFADDCGEVMYNVQDPDSLDCMFGQADTIWVSVWDESGNAALYPLHGLVYDTLSPGIVSCPDDILQGSCQGAVYFEAPTAVDNCAVTSVVQVQGPPSGSEFPLGTTEVRYVVTDLSGNSVECGFTVTIEAGAVLSATVQGVSCHGYGDGGIMLDTTHVAAPYTVVWNTGDTTVALTGLDGGSYLYWLTDANGCVAEDTIELPEPEAFEVSLAGVQDVSGPGAQDGAISISVSGGTAPYMYAWYLAGEVVSNEEDPTGLGPGLYTLSLADANGCVFAGLDVMVSVTTGVEDGSGESTQIYPNPAKRVVYVRLDHARSAQGRLELYDMTGRMVRRAVLAGPETEVGLNGLPSGLYVARIRTGSTGYTAPILVDQGR